MNLLRVKASDLCTGDLFYFVGESAPHRYLGLFTYSTSCYFIYRSPDSVNVSGLLYNSDFEVELLKL
jgi:hypothetical protein